MECVLDPNFWYICQILNGIKLFFCILGGLASVAGFAAMASQELGFEEMQAKVGMFIFITGLLMILACIFIPSQETYMKMAVTKHITLDNINIAKDGIISIKESFKQDIIDIIKATK